MNVRTIQFKTVSASDAQGLDEALSAAKSEIAQRNENAQFVGLEVSGTDSAVFATIIWIG